LTHKSTQKGAGDDSNFSIWVGDLAPELDDFAVYNFFKERFKSTQSARIMVDESGTSRGFGFVRFGDQQEQMSALGTMDRKTGLGDRPIKVSTAYNKGTNPIGGGSGESYSSGYGSSGTTSSYGGGAAAPTGGQTQDYSAQWAQYNQYWAQYNAWQQYYAANPGSEPQQGPAQTDQQQGQEQSVEKTKENGSEATEVNSTTPVQPQEKVISANVKQSVIEGNPKEPVDHKATIDVNSFEKAFFARSDELYLAIESSRWWYQSPL